MSTPEHHPATQPTDSSRTAPETPPAAPPPAAAPPPTGGWSAGRVVALVLGSLLAVGSLAMLAGGAVLAVADSALRDGDGYLMSSRVQVTSPWYAITSESVELHDGVATVDLPRRWVGEVKVEASPVGPGSLFVGIAPTDTVDAYLAGVGHSVVDDADGDPDGAATLDHVPGGRPTGLPREQGFWAAAEEGDGARTLTWEVEEGDWTFVVMDASAQAPVRAEVAVGATAPLIDDVALTLLVSGAVVGIAAAVVLVLVLRRMPGQLPSTPAGGQGS